MLWGIADSPPTPSTLLPTGYERTLSPEVQLTVRARRRALVHGARGRVLDLGGADTHRTLWSGVPDVDEVTVLDGAADPRLSALAVEGGRFDTVVTVFQLVAAPDLDTTLGRVADVLDGAGQVLFLEPSRLVGLPGRLQRLVAPPLGRFTGWRPDRNVPMALRAAGLSVTDIERHRVPTVQWWSRVLVEGTAHHALPPRPPG